MLSRLAFRNVQALPSLTQKVQCMSSLAPGFERRARPIDPSPVRHGFIPDSWFTVFYDKTGVTGPYMFGTGVTTYLLSKEIYVLEHEFYTGCTIFIMAVYAIKKLGPKLAAFLDKILDEEEAGWTESREYQVKANNELVENEKKEQWRTEAQKLILEAKKENILMQLEAAYRERLATVGTEVKKRLDFQMQISSVERRLAQKNMVRWIISNVMKGITPDQEKASLQQCIKDLQGLAPKA